MKEEEEKTASSSASKSRRIQVGGACMSPRLPVRPDYSPYFYSIFTEELIRLIRGPAIATAITLWLWPFYDQVRDAFEAMGTIPIPGTPWSIPANERWCVIMYTEIEWMITTKIYHLTTMHHHIIILLLTI